MVIILPLTTIEDRVIQDRFDVNFRHRLFSRDEIITRNTHFQSISVASNRLIPERPTVFSGKGERPGICISAHIE